MDAKEFFLSSTNIELNLTLGIFNLIPYFARIF